VTSTRNYALDFARGICLILMTVDHLPYNLLHRFTNAEFGPFGFFTGASGFVFISGLVAAKAYGTTYDRQGLGAVWSRSIRRAIQLYAVDIGLLLLLFACLALGVLDGEVWRRKVPLFFADPWSALGQGMLMLYTPSFFDILPVYVVLLLCVAPVLAAKRAGWTREILLVSLGLWLLAQTSHSTSLNPFGYQLLFMSGLIIGSCKMEDALQNPFMVRLGQVALVAALAFFVARVIMAFQPFQMSPNLGWIWRRLIHVDNNGPLRVLSFAVFVLVAIRVWPRIPDAIKRDNVLVTWVTYLGQHSLAVFAWSIFVTYVALALMPERPSLGFRALETTLAVASLAIPAFVHHRWKWRATAVVAHGERR
jgi:hypothetical protein